MTANDERATEVGMNRDEVIRGVARANGLSEHLAGQVVNPDGSVDQEKLALVLSAISWGQQPASKASPQVIEALEEALAKARQEKNMVAVMSLRAALGKLGILNA